VSAALAALYLVVDDFAVFRRGGKSILGDIVAWLNEPIPENEGGLLGTLRAIVGTIAEMLRLLDEAKRHFTGEATKGKVGDVLPGETPEAAAARLGGTYRRPEQGERYLPWFESAKSAMGLDAIPQPARSGGETGAGPGPQPAARGDTRTTATMPVSVTVNVGSGADAGEVGDAVAKAFEGLWDSKIRTEFVTLTGGTP
jgi:hypothetical protein